MSKIEQYLDQLLTNWFERVGILTPNDDPRGNTDHWGKEVYGDARDCDDKKELAIYLRMSHDQYNATPQKSNPPT